MYWYSSTRLWRMLSFMHPEKLFQTRKILYQYFGPLLALTKLGQSRKFLFFYFTFRLFYFFGTISLFYCFSRHNVGNWEKSSMFSSYDQAGIYLGILDTIFMSFYAIGLFASGYIAEKISIRIFLTIGTALNGISLFIFGFVLPMTNCTAFPLWVWLKFRKIIFWKLWFTIRTRYSASPNFLHFLNGKNSAKK